MMLVLDVGGLLQHSLVAKDCFADILGVAC